jgi:hypothetical protein
MGFEQEGFGFVPSVTTVVPAALPPVTISWEIVSSSLVYLRWSVVVLFVCDMLRGRRSRYREV